MKPGFCVGIGFDFHTFASNRKLILGGIEIEYGKGLLGHSDADVLVHALIDALLGAAGAGDIGTLYPDDDPQYLGISSMELLMETYRLIRDSDWVVGNVDVVVIAEKPRIIPYRARMKAALGEVLHISPESVSIKATTMEGKGPIGRSEGIAAQAVALLFRE
jgi:2-C-methyl-D-erythritol 2,4-cyclodiphosphate synthase